MAFSVVLLQISADIDLPALKIGAFLMPSNRAPCFVALALATAFYTPTASLADAPTCAGVTDNPANALINLLTPPPCDQCSETKTELNQLQRIQSMTTPEELKHAADDLTISVARFLDGADIKFDAGKLDKCSAEFFDRLGKLSSAASDNARNMFCRTRPYDTPGSAVHPLQELKNSASYPSGHSTWGTLIGTVLAHMVPEKRDQIMTRIADYGHSGMVGGMHYPSDVEAGKILGASLATDEFANDDAFKAAYPEASACVRDALGLPGQAAQEAPAPKP
jgi:acid phosphatase (class A)